MFVHISYPGQTGTISLKKGCVEGFASPISPEKHHGTGCPRAGPPCPSLIPCSNLIYLVRLYILQLVRDNMKVCVGPDECDCIPGYTGAPSCIEPLCVQSCENGGGCAAPDACACAEGWFGPNCTVPVCPQTCGNGGNCTAPGTCTCAVEWSGGGGAVAGVGAEGVEEGDDCRVPVCEAGCLNGGWCVAPETCTCPPQWTGHDCAMPVCTQVRGLDDWC